MAQPAADLANEIKKSIFIRHLCIAFEKQHGQWPSAEKLEDLEKNVLDEEFNVVIFGAMEEYKEYCDKRDALVENVSNPE